MIKLNEGNKSASKLITAIKHRCKINSFYYYIQIYIDAFVNSEKMTFLVKAKKDEERKSILYKRNFNYDELKNYNKYFKSFSSLEDIFISIAQSIEENKFNISNSIKCLSLVIKIYIKKIKKYVNVSINLNEHKNLHPLSMNSSKQKEIKKIMLGIQSDEELSYAIYDIRQRLKNLEINQSMLNNNNNLINLYRNNDINLENKNFKQQTITSALNDNNFNNSNFINNNYDIKYYNKNPNKRNINNKVNSYQSMNINNEEKNINPFNNSMMTKPNTNNYFNHSNNLFPKNIKANEPNRITGVNELIKKINELETTINTKDNKIKNLEYKLNSIDTNNDKNNYIPNLKKKNEKNKEYFNLSMEANRKNNNNSMINNYKKSNINTNSQINLFKKSHIKALFNKEKSMNGSKIIEDDNNKEINNNKKNIKKKDNFESKDETKDNNYLNKFINKYKTIEYSESNKNSGSEIKEESNELNINNTNNKKNKKKQKTIEKEDDNNGYISNKKTKKENNVKYKDKSMNKSNTKKDKVKNNYIDDNINNNNINNNVYNNNINNINQKENGYSKNIIEDNNNINIENNNIIENNNNINNKKNVENNNIKKSNKKKIDISKENNNNIDSSSLESQEEEENEKIKKFINKKSNKKDQKESRNNYKIPNSKIKNKSQFIKNDNNNNKEEEREEIQNSNNNSIRKNNNNNNNYSIGSYLSRPIVRHNVNKSISSSMSNVKIKIPKKVPIFPPEKLSKLLNSNIIFRQVELNLLKSKLLNNNKKDEIFFHLLYRASRDGDNDTIIKKNALGYENVLTLFYTNEGARFGIFIKRKQNHYIKAKDRGEKIGTCFIIGLNNLVIYDIYKNRSGKGDFNKVLCFGCLDDICTNGTKWMIYTPQNNFLNKKCIMGSGEGLFKDIDIEQIVGPPEYSIKDVEIFNVEMGKYEENEDDEEDDNEI